MRPPRRRTVLLTLLLVAVVEAAIVLRLASGVVFDMVRVVYDLHTLWLPPLALMAALAVRQLRWPGAAWLLAVALSLAGVRVWCTHVEPAMLVVRHVEVATGKLDRPLRVLHLSDMQPARVGWIEARAIAKARALAPDLVLYTGDLIQPRRHEQVESELAKMAALLRTLDPPHGMYAVPGDTDAPILGRPAGELGGLRLLESAEAEIPLGTRRLRILGLDLDESRANVSRRVAAWKSRGDASDLTIVMGHAPDYALSLERSGVDLCLAGHTHGGQVVIPWHGPPFIASAVPAAWARGLHTFGTTRVHVSAGAGAEHGWRLPSLRFNCPSEMTLIDLS